MNEIKCPHCGKAFTINETDYESIVKQIKNHEFEKELDIRIKQFNSEKENAVKLAEVNTEKKMQEEINSLKLELITAQNKLQESEKEKRNIDIDYLRKGVTAYGI